MPQPIRERGGRLPRAAAIDARLPASSLFSFPLSKFQYLPPGGRDSQNLNEQESMQPITQLTWTARSWNAQPARKASAGSCPVPWLLPPAGSTAKPPVRALSPGDPALRAAGPPKGLNCELCGTQFRYSSSTGSRRCGPRHGNRTRVSNNCRPGTPGTSPMQVPEDPSPHCPGRSYTNPRTTHPRFRSCHAGPRSSISFLPPVESISILPPYESISILPPYESGRMSFENTMPAATSAAVVRKSKPAPSACNCQSIRCGTLPGYTWSGFPKTWQRPIPTFDKPPVLFRSGFSLGGGSPF